MDKFLKWSNIWPVLLALVIISCVVCTFIYSLLKGSIITPSIEENPVDEYSFLYYLLSVVITSLIAYIAWHQFRRVNQNLKSDYLMRIAEMWHSSEIVKARIIIHKIYLKERNLMENKNPSYKSNELHKEISQKIDELSSSDKEQDIKDFISLLNFIDFMKVVGYQYSNGKLELSDINGLVGLSIKFNYTIFMSYIHTRRERHSEDNYSLDNIDDSKTNVFYSGFNALYNDLVKNK